MPYCASCGQLILANGRFCTSCGTGVGGPSNQATPVPSVQPLPPVIRMVTEKSGGWLATKGFLVAIILGGISRAAVEKSDPASIAVGMFISFGIGAAYVITNLRKWKRQNVPVNGTAIAWGMAILLILGCIGALGLMSAHNSGHLAAETAPAASDNNSGDTVTIPPKAKLSPEEMKKARILYARDFDRKLIEAGIESSTLAWGPDETTLQITYALTGRVTANEFGKKLDFDELRSLGFKKVVLTNGFGGDAGASFVWYVQ